MMLTPERLLELSIILPMLAVVGILLCSRWENLREAVSLITSSFVFYCLVNLYQTFQQGEQVMVSWWAMLPGLTISFSLDALGILFALIASFLWMITTLYAIGYMRSHSEKNQTRFYAFFAVAISSVMGIAFADNLFTLFIFYEVLTLSTYPLVTHAGSDKAKQGGRVYLGILIGTSIAFFLLAIVATWYMAGTLDFKAGGIFPDTADPTIVGIILILFIFGVGKAAIMPFHRWLPSAMVAPTPVSALLHAVAVVKAGVFTVIKICVYIFGIDLLAVLPSTQFLLYLAGASILIASLVAMRQDNLKARLAYSTISQLSYMTMGALLATSSGVIGSSMHIATHAFGKITLFFCAGAILVAAHKSKISEMGGIGKQMPITMIAFFIGSLSIIGVPPAGGTWSKWFLVLGTLEAEQAILMMILLLSTLLNIVYLLPIPFRAFFPVNGHSEFNSGIKEAPLASLVAIVLTTIGCLILFIYPQPVYELSKAILSVPEVIYGQ